MPIEYEPAAAQQLDHLEKFADDQTWDAICDVLDLIDQQPGSAIARREEITGANGIKMWRIPVRSRSIEDLVVLWASRPTGDFVVYVGTMPAVR